MQKNEIITTTVLQQCNITKFFVLQKTYFCKHLFLISGYKFASFLENYIGVNCVKIKPMILWSMKV